MSKQEKDLPVVVADNDQPYLIGCITSLLNTGLDFFSGKHQRSWRHGYIAGVKETLLQSGHAQKPVADAVALTLSIKDCRDKAGIRRPLDNHIFDESKVVISAGVKQQIRDDAARLLGDDLQPTPDQWKAVLSPSLATCTVGIAGTGKTRVMAMRVVLLHFYLHIQLQDITVLSLTKDCRLDVIALLTELFSLWGSQLGDEVAARLVKTPRGALLNQVRELPDLAEVVPFDLLADSAAFCEDGRPFDNRLTQRQYRVLDEAYQHAYQHDPEFASSIKELFRANTLLPALPIEEPVVVRRAPLAWAQSKADIDITEAVERLWQAAGAWPMKHMEATITPVSIRGSIFHFNGYIPALDAFVVLGFDRSEYRHLTRPNAKVELFKESEVKRTMLQAYSPKPVIHLDSYAQAKALSLTIEQLSRSAPEFECMLKGEAKTLPVAEAMYHAGTLMETLGLSIPNAINSMNFMSNDSDAYFFQSLAAFWPAFESFLLASKPPSFTFNRLFLMFGAEGEANIKHLPDSALRGMRHVLADEVQDLTVPIGEWMKACLLENRRRRLAASARGEVRPSCTLFVSGDDYQTAHGSQGATARYLLDFESEFRSKVSAKVILGENFRSHQSIIDAAHSMVLGIPAVNGIAPVSHAGKARSGQEPVKIHHLNGEVLSSVLQHHFDKGEDILILAANPDDFRLVEAEINVILEKDKLNGTDRRVRVRACQRAKGLEAETVLILGDFTAPLSTWSKNQIYRLANELGLSDQSPFDTIQQNELYRLAHIGITRARKNCYWFIRKVPEGEAVQMRASIRIQGQGNFIKDLRN